MKKKYYAAYGSNLNIEQMQWRCPSAKIAGVSEIPDYQLLFKGSKTGSYLTIERKKGSRVPVAVWGITEKDELSLDRYEGFPLFYYKAEMMLPIENLYSMEVKRHKCFVYIMHEDRGIGMPNGQYVRVCSEGYEYFGFDERYLDTALKISKEVIWNERRRGHDKDQNLSEVW